MKTRHPFLFFSLLLAAVLFVSCSENTATGGEDGPTPKEVTKFTSGNPTPDNIFGMLKTAMDNGGNHYWTEGDHIWVKSGSTYYKDVDNSIMAVQAVADFSIPGTLTDNSYEVFYVGQNSPQASSATANTLKVTIAATQQQPIPNNGEHFGRSGDCGTATATKVSSGSSSVNNEYSFRLNHRSTYLIFAPKDPNVETAGKCKLKKIKVESDNAICGTYDFTTGHLTNGTSTGNTITLEVGEEFDGVKGQDFPIPTTQDVRTNGAFMVIQPGTHALTITYTVEYYGITQEITKTVASRDFLENKYYTIGHTLNVQVPEFVFYFPDTYYQWDAQKWYWYGQETYPTIVNTTNSTYPRSQQTDPERWFSTVESPNNASNSAKDMPNANELSWYAAYGDPRMDFVTEWSLGGVKQRGGLWLKKWNKITASGKSKTVGFDNTDWRTNQKCRTWKCTIGRPSNTDDYFFLPLLGQYNSGQFQSVGVLGWYWSSSPTARGLYERGAALYIYGDKNYDPYVAVSTNDTSSGGGSVDGGYYYSWDWNHRSYGRVAGHRPDGSNWFQ